MHVESGLALTESLIVKDDRAKVERGCENKVSGDRERRLLGEREIERVDKRYL